MYSHIEANYGQLWPIIKLNIKWSYNSRFRQHCSWS